MRVAMPSLRPSVFAFVALCSFAAPAVAAPDTAAPREAPPPPRRPAAIANTAPPLPSQPVTTAAPAAPAAAPRTVPVKRAGKKKPAAPPAPEYPAPSVTLAIEAPSPEAAWTMRVTNTGAVPLHLTADAHLLSFDVTAPGAKRAVHCELPRVMRPDDEDTSRALVVPPGRSYAEKLDPRLFCFGARDGAALVPDAKVVAHLGSPAKGHLGPPYVVEPIEGLEPRVAAAKEIVSEAATIGPVPAASATAEAAPRPLAIHTPAYVDTDDARDLALEVDLKNQTARSVTFLLRPETLTFDVTGPSGVGVTDPSPTVRCAPHGDPNTSVRDAFTTVRAEGRTALTVMLAVLCPEHTFDHAGLYAVRAKLDTRHASGRQVGLQTLDAEVPADAVTRVRVRIPIGRPPRAQRPVLEDPPHTS
jgi:hypothetical protein